MPDPNDVEDLRVALKVISKPGLVEYEHLPLFQHLRNRGLVSPADPRRTADTAWKLTRLGRETLARSQPQVICHREGIRK